MRAVRALVPALALAAVAALAGSAAADSMHLGPADRDHDWSGLDRLTGRSELWLDAGWVDMSGGSTIDLSKVTVVRFDLGGEFVSKEGFGAYGLVPLSVLSFPDTTFGVPPVSFTINGETDTAFGNIELGGLYALRTAKADAVFRLGFALPTAETGNAEATFGPFSAATRLGDLVDVWPHTTWLRMSASPTARFGPLFLRGDFGVDVTIAHDDTYTKIGPIVRLGLGGGVDLGAADVTVELMNLFLNQDGNNADNSWQELTIGARYTEGAAHPGLSIGIPLGVGAGYDNANLAIVGSIAANL
jgi:hypothetical protein